MNSLSFTVAFILASAALPCALAAEPAREAPNAHWLNKVYPHGKRAKDVVGMRVLGNAGEDIGRVADLVVDTGSGRIVYAIVSSGGVVGLGSTRHAVPFSALTYANDYQDSLKLNVTPSEWAKAPVYSDNQFASLGDPARSDYLFQYYRQPWQPISSGNPVKSDQVAESDSGLRLATSLYDREVRASGQEIGRAEDLIVDVGARHASLLLDADSRFAGGPGQYVVPFSYLSARTGDSDTLAATLTRTDLNNARPLDDMRNANGAKGVYRWDVGDTR
ncbi:hypothetical protein DB347_10050 [Opitutaceae bacterium EW11]|nr:hypothetical protein DB347_10050 [Opitutaceae bacterium EW11]